MANGAAHLPTIIRPATEDEMILEFVAAEIESPRFRSSYELILNAIGRSSADLIDKPDLHNETDNRLRLMLLDLRGYSNRERLFTEFPRDVTWEHVQLSLEELKFAKYARVADWIRLSLGTRLVCVAASNLNKIDEQDSLRETVAMVRTVASQCVGAKKYRKLIAVKNGPDIVIVEGHIRATAFVLAEINQPIDMLLGFSPLTWLWERHEMR